MITLFEYGQWESVHDKNGLNELLRGIWRQRLFIPSDQSVVEFADDHYQPFLQFEDNNVRACNYVGFIQSDVDFIEIYPKVFSSTSVPDRHLMLQHIFYWFSYCRKWRFPFTQASLDTRDIDSIPELIIHLIACQFHQTVVDQPLMQYQEASEAMQVPRGAINFGRYITTGIVRGNYHMLECDYEPFLFDNKVNRTIKYCTRLLLDKTKFAENQRVLQEIIFVLDEVEDVAVSSQEVDTLKLNTFFADYELVMEMCAMVLRQQLYSHVKYDMSQWCLLFPMEYVFEDFIAGFLDRHFSADWKVEYQKSDSYLSSNPKAFNLQHDIFLTSRDGNDRKIIIDTKYKLCRFEEGDVRRGIAQSDLYQAVSYAYRRGCEEVILVYPNLQEIPREPARFQIPSGFSDMNIINVTAIEVPFWSMKDSLKLEILLKAHLTKVLNSD